MPVRIVRTSSLAIVVIAATALTMLHPTRAGGVPSSPPGPNVTVVNGAANPVPVTGSITGTVTGNVTVTNTPSVHNADDPARQPYQNSFSLQIDPGESADKFETFDPQIPANTRLAIDRVNVLGEMPVGQALVGVNVLAFVGGSASGNFIGATFHGTSPSGVIFGGPLDIYSADSGPGLFADSGANNLELSAFRNGTTGTAHVFVQVYGHLVSVP